MIRSAKSLLLAVSLGGLACSVKPRSKPPSAGRQSRRLLQLRHGPPLRGVGRAYGNKPEYVTKAIQHYQEALKLDPSASHRLRRAHRSVHSDRPPARRRDAGRGYAEAEPRQPGCAPHAGPHLHADDRHAGQSHQRRLPAQGHRAVPEDHGEGPQGCRKLGDAGAALPRRQQLRGRREGLQRGPRGGPR